MLYTVHGETQDVNPHILPHCKIESVNPAHRSELLLNSTRVATLLSQKINHKRHRRILTHSRDREVQTMEPLKIDRIAERRTLRTRPLVKTADFSSARRPIGRL